MGFLSLGAFADAMGTGVATDYVAERVGAAGTSGWATHAITPLQSGTTYDGILDANEPLYVGEFTADLSTGVFFAQSPLTADPNTADVPNLYRRADLLTPGQGAYELITRCPLCDETQTPLPSPPNADATAAVRPRLAWMSPDGARIAFESQLRLTADTPPFLNRVELYEWERGSVALVGRVPRGGLDACDDVNGPVCVPIPYSIAGQGATNLTPTPNVVSDGSDGHGRTFFTFPTTNGVTPNPGGAAGQLYMRVDGSATVQLNASERSVASAYAPATFLAASKDGERIVFKTIQALTDNAPVNGDAKIYVYNASKPVSARDHLTLINADNEPGDTTLTDGQGVVGLSDDGQYIYFSTIGQIVRGEPLLNGEAGLYLWHDGTVRFIAAGGGDFATGENWTFGFHQSRVTPDGRWLLYRGVSGTTEQFFLYGADSGATPVCVSCNSSGGPDTADAVDVVRTGVGGTSASWHENRPLASDGSRVFFSTAQALVPEDVNGKVDVYEYDVNSRSVQLISSGTSPDDSWFMDASASGNDVFFTTSQELVGWDVDQEYDVYDARVRGGFPEPAPRSQPCAGDVCRGVLASPPVVQPAASAVFSGLGNLRHRTRTCRRGFVRKRVRGHVRCVRRPKQRRRRRPAPARRASKRRGA